MQLVRKTVLPAMQFRPSENQSDRNGYDPEWVVLHYDAGSDGRRVADWMQGAAARVSAHFHIFRDGGIIQTVPLDKAAWHCGASEWWYQGEMTHGANRFTIGIELANLGYLYKGKSGKFWYEVGGNLYRYRGPEPIEATLLYDSGREIHGAWEPYTKPIYDTLERLLDSLAEHGWATQLTGHESIGMPFGRKKDPGPAFEWGRFADYRIRTSRAWP